MTGPALDVWRIEDTVGLLLTRSEINLENVLRSFVLSCNAFAFDIRREQILEIGALDSLASAELTFVRNAIFHSRPTFAAKALLMSYRSPLKPSPEVQLFIRKFLRRDVLLHEVKKLRRNPAGSCEQDARN